MSRTQALAPIRRRRFQSARRLTLMGGALEALAPFHLPQHADQYRPERSILLAVDEQFGEGAALRVAPELADAVGAIEVGEHQDMKQLGAGSWPEDISAFTELSFDLPEVHGAGR